MLRTGGVVPSCSVTSGLVAPASSGGSIEIEFAARVRMRITDVVNSATLKAAVAALVRWTAAMT